MSATSLHQKNIEQKIQDFFKDKTPKQYIRGQIIVMPGEDPPGVMYIKSGKINQYDLSPRGDKVIVNSFKAGSFFPMSWAINQTENAYLFEASDDTLIQIATPESAVDFIQGNPDVMFDLLSRVYRGTDGVLRNLALLMGSTARHRLLNELVTYAKRFGENFEENKYTLKVTESELGSRTGLSRETVSRELNHLKRDKTIEVSRGTITIQDLSRLESSL